MYVSGVSEICCKSRSGCCICCDGCTYVANVYSQCFICFSNVCYKCVYLDVAYVLYICYKYFIWMLRMFAIVFKYFQVFLQVFHMHVSSVSSIFIVCYKCCIWIFEK
jgi:hypothetical protein